MDDFLRDTLLRLSDRLDSSDTLDGAGDWIRKHTTLEGKRWSFKDHEFQLDIVNCSATHAVIQKPTQVGLTELSLRLALSLCAMKQYFGLIYTFPSAEFAREVTKTRVDPIIEGSKRLSDLMVRGSDSSAMKRIGTSMFYMGGAATKSQAISRPVKALFCDEKDFSNQTVLSSYHGRLRHVHPEHRVIREFSTPTVSGYGINADLVKSTKQRYMVKCKHCATWQAPDFKTQVTIPRWDMDDFTYFTKDDLTRLDVSKAYLRCIKCGKDLDKSLRSTGRKWVAEHPDREIVGFEVKPFDLPLYNTIPDLVRSYGRYSDETDYWNFVQGEVFNSSDNQIDTNLVTNNFTLPFLDRADGMCLGIDVGQRYVYAVAGVKKGQETHVLWRKRLDIRDGSFVSQIERIVEVMNPVGGCMDIGPDFTLSRTFIEMGQGSFYAVRYRSDDVGAVGHYSISEGVVSAQRTKSFNLMARDMNKGLWKFAVGEDKPVLLSHLTGMKRISTQNTEGDSKQTWIKIENQEDHYLHACMYLKLALDIINEEGTGVTMSVLPMPSGVGIGSKAR